MLLDNVSLSRHSGDNLAPNAPTNLSATLNSSGGVDLSWQESASDTGGTIVDRSDDSGASWHQLAIVTQGSNSFTDDVAASSATAYRTSAVNDAGRSPGSAPVFALPPSAVTDLTATASGAGTIDLAWSDVSPSATGYLIEQSDDNGAHYHQIAALDAGANQYSATNLYAETAYTFRVTATDDAGASVPATASATTSAVQPLDLTANDDNSSVQTDIGFPINFYGYQPEHVWINNNGNLTFDGGMPDFTPFDLTQTQRAIIAPFFADVDTRNGGGTVTSHATTVNGRRAFEVDWNSVDYYNITLSDTHQSLRNTFSVTLIDRSDVAPGDFDINFDYGDINWDTGDASGGENGFATHDPDTNELTGSPARIGWSNGSGREGTSFEVAGSGEDSAFVGSGPGQQHFEIRNPVVSVVATTPVGSEDGRTPAVFQVSRSGAPLTQNLKVYFMISGTATPSMLPASSYPDGISTDGTDYTISGATPDSSAPGYWAVVIPAGAATADVTATPLNDSVDEGDETIQFALADDRAAADAAEPAYAPPDTNPVGKPSMTEATIAGPTTQAAILIPTGEIKAVKKELPVTLPDGSTGTLSLIAQNYATGEIAQQVMLEANFVGSGTAYSWKQFVHISILKVVGMSDAQFKKVTAAEIDEHFLQDPFADFVPDNGGRPPISWADHRRLDDLKERGLTRNDLPADGRSNPFKDYPMLIGISLGGWGLGSMVRKDFKLELYANGVSTGLVVAWSATFTAQDPKTAEFGFYQPTSSAASISVWVTTPHLAQ